MSRSAWANRRCEGWRRLRVRRGRTENQGGSAGPVTIGMLQTRSGLVRRVGCPVVGRVQHVGVEGQTGPDTRSSGRGSFRVCRGCGSALPPRTRITHPVFTTPKCKKAGSSAGAELRRDPDPHLGKKKSPSDDGSAVRPVARLGEVGTPGVVSLPRPESWLWLEGDVVVVGGDVVVEAAGRADPSGDGLARAVARVGVVGS